MIMQVLVRLANDTIYVICGAISTYQRAPLPLITGALILSDNYNSLALILALKHIDKCVSEILQSDGPILFVLQLPLLHKREELLGEGLQPVFRYEVALDEAVDGDRAC